MPAWKCSGGVERAIKRTPNGACLGCLQWKGHNDGCPEVRRVLSGAAEKPIPPKAVRDRQMLALLGNNAVQVPLTATEAALRQAQQERLTADLLAASAMVVNPDGSCRPGTEVERRLADANTMATAALTQAERHMLELREQRDRWHEMAWRATGDRDLAERELTMALIEIAALKAAAVSHETAMMGIPVTVDSDDLEVLLFATGVVKAMEAAVQAADRDQQFKMAKPKIAAAHDRVANAWRGATRKRDMPNIVREPIGEEVNVLMHLARIGATKPEGVERINAHFYSRFVGMGVAEIGPHDERVVFNAGSGEVWNGRSPWQRVRLREAGKELVPGWDVGEGDRWTVERSLEWLANWERESSENTASSIISSAPKS